jgi:hypothetical protein
MVHLDREAAENEGRAGSLPREDFPPLSETWNCRKTDISL